MNKDLHEYITHYRQTVNDHLITALNKLNIPNKLKQSMIYSVEAGGKRIRPILLFATNQAYKENLDKTYSAAIALEMIHTYSLIHDDLPAMDDDDYRRGKLTNHKAFDEATAILAGDALLTYSFEIIAEDEHLSSKEKVYLTHLLAKASGPKGMIAGQMLDLEAENQDISLDELENIHRLKTGQLLKFPILAGAYLGQATEEEMLQLEKFAHYLGLIFQIQDDILDIIGDEDKIGKDTGSDEENEKSTYPKLLGLDGAKRQRDIYLKKAEEALDHANGMNSLLGEIAEYLTKRDS